MPSITVRNIDEDLKQRLRVRASQHGCSMEEEVRNILRAVLIKPQPAAPPLPQNLGTVIHELFKPLGLTESEFKLAPRSGGSNDPCCNPPEVDESESA